MDGEIILSQKGEIAKKFVAIRPEIVDQWMKSKSKRTRETYRDALRCLQKFMGCVTELQMLSQFFSLSRGDAFLKALAWRTWMLEKNHAPKTVNTWLSALRSLSKLLYAAEISEWMLVMDGVKSELKRDVHGPKLVKIRELWVAAKDQAPGVAVRDIAILELLLIRALRRAEVCSLDVEDMNLPDIRVLRKRHRTKITLDVAPSTSAAIEAWLKVRGRQPGPLFFDGSERMKPKTVYLIVRALGKRIGIKLWPHALRHSAATLFLEASDGDIRGAQALLGHADTRMVSQYDDERRNLAGKASKGLSDFMALGENGPAPTGKPEKTP